MVSQPDDFEDFDGVGQLYKVGGWADRRHGRRDLLTRVRTLAPTFDPANDAHARIYHALVEDYGAMEVARLFTVLGRSGFVYIEQLTVMINASSDVQAAITRCGNNIRAGVLGLISSVGLLLFLWVNLDKIAEGLAAFASAVR